jgi:hypothetical protein
MPSHDSVAPRLFATAAAVDAAAVFPCVHPSARTVLQLGLWSLLLGPFAGVPAVLLARSVRADLDRAPHIYSGRRDVTRGSILGLAGTAVIGALELALLGYAAPHLVATLAVLAGLAGAAALSLAYLERRSKTKSFLPTGLGLALLCLAPAVVGGGDYRQTREEEIRAAAVRACKSAREAARGALDSGHLDAAQKHIAEADKSCTEKSADDLRELRTQLTARQDAQRKAEEEARQARLEKEFAGKAPEIAKQLQTATTLANTGKWSESSAALDTARGALTSFQGSRVATSKEWLALDASISKERTRIAPFLAKLESQRQANETAARKREEAAEQARQRAAARPQPQPQSEGPRSVRCRDGTLSPKCICGGRLQGCCSHHGGVAGCE